MTRVWTTALAAVALAFVGASGLAQEIEERAPERRLPRVPAFNFDAWRLEIEPQSGLVVTSAARNTFAVYADDIPAQAFDTQLGLFFECHPLSRTTLLATGHTQDGRPVALVLALRNAAPDDDERTPMLDCHVTEELEGNASMTSDRRGIVVIREGTLRVFELDGGTGHADLIRTCDVPRSTRLVELAAPHERRRCVISDRDSITCLDLDSGLTAWRWKPSKAPERSDDGEQRDNALAPDRVLRVGRIALRPESDAVLVELGVGAASNEGWVGLCWETGTERWRIGHRAGERSDLHAGTQCFAVEGSGGAEIQVRSVVTGERVKQVRLSRRQLVGPTTLTPDDLHVAVALWRGGFAAYSVDPDPPDSPDDYDADEPEPDPEDR